MVSHDADAKGEQEQKASDVQEKARFVHVSIRMWISEPSGRVAARRIESFPRSPSPQNQITKPPMPY